MGTDPIVGEKHDGDVYIEDTASPETRDAVVNGAVRIEGEIWKGINIKTVLAFLVRVHRLLPLLVIKLTDEFLGNRQ
jgi:hypothetical protein